MDNHIGRLVRAVADGGSDAYPVRLSSAEWQLLGSALERIELPSGAMLLRRGERERRAYLVERGQLQVFVAGGGARNHRVALLEAGTMVGEPALFVAAPRQAHVEAVTACVVWALCAERLHALAADAPALALEVLRAAGALMCARTRANVERGIPAP